MQTHKSTSVNKHQISSDRNFEMKPYAIVCECFLRIFFFFVFTLGTLKPIRITLSQRAAHFSPSRMGLASRQLGNDISCTLYLIRYLIIFISIGN